MSAALTVEVKGLRELQALIRQSGDAGLKAALAQANKAGADVVAQAAKPRAPRRSGRLAGSIRALGSQAKGRVRAGGAGVPYAAAIHWGRRTGNVGRPPGNHPGPNPIAGVPFLTDAASASTSRVVDVYRQAIDEKVVAPLRK